MSDMGMVPNPFNYPMEFFNHAIHLFIYKKKETTIYPRTSFHYYSVSSYTRLLKNKRPGYPSLLQCLISIIFYRFEFYYK